MAFPLATADDLRELLAETERALERMDSADVVDPERWWNLYEERVERRNYLRAELAVLEEAS